MSDSNFRGTLGKWEVIGKQGTAIWCGNKIIAQMAFPREHHREARANAVLMAAAPAMLAALEKIASETAATWVQDVALAAIEKATQ